MNIVPVTVDVNLLVELTKDTPSEKVISMRETHNGYKRKKSGSKPAVKNKNPENTLIRTNKFSAYYTWNEENIALLRTIMISNGCNIRKVCDVIDYNYSSLNYVILKYMPDLKLHQTRQEQLKDSTRSLDIKLDVNSLRELILCYECVDMALDKFMADYNPRKLARNTAFHYLRNRLPKLYEQYATPLQRRRFQTVSDKKAKAKAEAMNKAK